MTRHFLFLLLLPPLSGCIGDGPSFDILTVPAVLPCDNRDWCHRELQPDGRLAYVVQDVHLSYLIFNATFAIQPVRDEVVILRRVTIDSTGHGLRLQDACSGNCEIRIEDTRIIGHGTGTGILGNQRWSDSLATVRLRNVTVEGFHTGIDLWTFSDSFSSTFVVDGVRIGCLNQGLLVQARDLEIAGLEISGCAEEAARIEVTGAGTVRDSKLNDSRTGLLAYVDGRLVVTDSQFNGNRHLGINGQRNGVLQMMRLELQGNGFQPAPSLGGAAILAIPDGFLHDSTIVGNAFGLEPALNVPYDATNNYWGDPNGPSVCPGGVPEPPIGGDCVSHQVNFYPYRTSPP